MLVDLPRTAENLVNMLELGRQIGGEQVRWHVGRARIDPGVLVDLATEELTAIGTFFPDDFGYSEFRVQL